MKKILSLSAAVYMLLVFSAHANVSEVSKRMDGINRELVGIVADEYSDFMRINTSNILKVEGYRVYTQLSNLGASGKDKAIDGNVADDDLLIGGISPLKDGDASIGIIMWANRSREEESIQQYSFNTNLDHHAGTTGGIDAENTDLYSITNTKGEYEYEFKDDEKIISESGEAYNNSNDINLNILGGIKTLDVGNIGYRLTYDRDTNKNINYEYSLSSQAIADENDFEKQDYSGQVKDSTSTLRLALSLGQFELGNFNLDAEAAFSLISSVNNYKIDAVIDRGSSLHTGDSTYQRKYARDDKEELSGSEIGLKVSALYPLRSAINLRGYAAFDTSKITGDKKEAKSDEITQDGGMTIDTEKWEETRTTQIEKSNTQITAAGGLEKELSDMLLMSAGLGFEHSLKRDISDQGRELTDEDGTKEYSQSIEKTTAKTAENSIFVPVGFEWKPNTWLSARLGATYKVDFTKETIETETTNYEGNEEDDSVESVTTEKEADQFKAVDKVDFYSGVGFLVNENLRVDATGLASNGSILDLSAWELSLTLKF